jgi:hypothetical protein
MYGLIDVPVTLVGGNTTNAVDKYAIGHDMKRISKGQTWKCYVKWNDFHV